MKKFVVERMGDAPVVTVEASRFERGEEITIFYDDETSDKSLTVAIFDNHPVTAIYPDSLSV